MDNNDQQSAMSASSGLCNENYNSATQSTASGSHAGEDSKSENAPVSHSEYAYSPSLRQQKGIRSENADSKEIVANNLSCQRHDLANNCWEKEGMLNVNKENAMGKVQQILRYTLPVEVPDEKIEICHVAESQAKDSGVDRAAANSVICVRLDNLSTIQRIITEKVKNAQSFSFVYDNDGGTKGTTVTVRRVHSEKDVDPSYSTAPHSIVNSEPEAKIALPQHAYNVPSPPAPSKDNKLLILRNGCTHGEFRFNGVYYLLSNTCAFDSIAQILMTRGTEDASYCNYITHGPKNTTMDFIQHFMSEGATASVYRHRMDLFLSLFDYKVDRRTSDGSISQPHSINMWSSIGEMWIKCFQSRPSLNIHCWCRNCGPYTSSQSIFLVRLNKKIEHGSCLLEETVKSTGLISKCLKCGTDSTTVLNTYNEHLCFEFSILVKADLDGLKCKLEEIPTTLDLEYGYRLCGIISAEAGHFTAYCRKANDCWEEHNDSAWSVRPVDPTERIMIASAIFTKTGHMFAVGGAVGKLSEILRTKVDAQIVI